MLLGIVLAGGQSSRMGQDKALLTIEGKTQLARCCTQLHNVGCDRVIVSRNQADFVCDEYKNSGPLGGIHACLKHSFNSSMEEGCINEALILPIDMPLLYKKVLKDIRAIGLKNKQNCHYETAIFPLYLYQPYQQIMHLKNRLKQKNRSIKSWLTAINSHQIIKPVSEHLLAFINTNTPAQWQQVQRIISNKTHEELL